MFTGRKLGTQLQLPEGITNTSICGALPDGRIFGRATAPGGKPMIFSWTPATNKTETLAEGFYLQALHPAGKYMHLTRESGQYPYRLGTAAGAQPEVDDTLLDIGMRVSLNRLQITATDRGCICGVGRGWLYGRSDECWVGWYARDDGHYPQRLPFEVESQAHYLDGGKVYGVLRPHNGRVALAGLTSDWRAFGYRVDQDPFAADSRQQLMKRSLWRPWFWSIPLAPYQGGQLCLAHRAGPQAALAIWSRGRLAVQSWFPKGYLVLTAGSHTDGTRLFILDGYHSNEANGRKLFALWRPNSELEVIRPESISGLPPESTISFIDLVGQYLLADVGHKTSSSIYILED